MRGRLRAVRPGHGGVRLTTELPALQPRHALGHDERVSDVTRLLVAIATSDHQAAAGPSRRDAVVGDRRRGPTGRVLPGRAPGAGLRRRHRPACCGVQLRRRDGPAAGRTRRGRAGEEPEGCRTAPRGGASARPGRHTGTRRRQQAVIRFLVEAGADPNARAAGGVTPLHRAVRNRCSAAVEVLLAAGADPRLENDRGSTASDLAQWTTGRGGTGSAAARGRTTHHHRAARPGWLELAGLIAVAAVHGRSRRTACGRIGREGWPPRRWHLDRAGER